MGKSPNSCRRDLVQVIVVSEMSLMRGAEALIHYHPKRSRDEGRQLGHQGWKSEIDPRQLRECAAMNLLLFFDRENF